MVYTVHLKQHSMYSRQSHTGQLHVRWCTPYIWNRTACTHCKAILDNCTSDGVHLTSETGQHVLTAKPYWTTASPHRSSAILSPRVRHCISRRHFTSSSAIHQQSAIWTGAHASVRWTFVLVCRTKSLEQSPVFTARTHRHQNFQTQTKGFSFSAGLSLNLCSSIRFVFYFILFLLALCNPLVNSIL